MGTSPCKILPEIWQKWSRRNGAPPHYITMDGSTGIKMSGQQIGVVVQNLFTESLGASQASLITSYSWRRIGATLADTLRAGVE